MLISKSVTNSKLPKREILERLDCMLTRLSRLRDRFLITWISPVFGSTKMYLPKSRVLCSSSSTISCWIGLLLGDGFLGSNVCLVTGVLVPVLPERSGMFSITNVIVSGDFVRSLNSDDFSSNVLLCLPALISLRSYLALPSSG